jgi:hypothetical protein
MDMCRGRGGGGGYEKGDEVLVFWDFGSRVWDSSCRARGAGYRVKGLEFRI